jgi:putative oxidoreductase
MVTQSTEGRLAPSRHGFAIGIDGLAASSYDSLLLVARVLLGLVFVLSGYGKLTGLAAFSASLAARGVPAPEVFGIVGACVEFFGGVAVVLGVASRYVAVLMIVFVVVATLISHRFWEHADPQQFRAQQGQFMKNVTMIGGYVLLFACGGGRFSMDALWRRKRG